MVTLVTVGLAALTVTAAVPLLPLSASDAALTVRVLSTSSLATVSTPPVVIVVPAFLLVSTIDQVTDCEGLLVPFTVAVKVLFPPLATVAAAGLTATELTVGSDPAA